MTSYSEAEFADAVYRIGSHEPWRNMNMERHREACARAASRYCSAAGDDAQSRFQALKLASMMRDDILKGRMK